MVSFSSLVHRISGQRSTAWAVHHAGRQRQADGGDVIFLSIGDPDFATPEPIVERAVEALRSGDTHYTVAAGRPALRSAIADRFAARTGAPVDERNVVVVPGTQNALFATSLCLLEPGDEVISFDPMYVTYEATLCVGGAHLVPVAAPAEGGFRPDPALVESAITPRTKAIMLTTPANPTGVVASRTELQGLAELAIENDLWVIADEVYADLVYDGEHCSIAGIDGMAERTATVSSLSKSHAMTGWRCGWIIGPAELAQHVERLAMPMLYGIPGFVQEAAIRALTDADAIVDEMRATYRRRRDLVVDLLAEARNLPVLSPAAGMYVMVDVRAFAMTSAEFSWTLLDRKNVSALDAGAFGPSADGWLRLAFTVGEAELTEGCRRIVELTHELSRA